MLAIVPNIRTIRSYQTNDASNGPNLGNVDLTQVREVLKVGRRMLSAVISKDYSF